MYRRRKRFPFMTLFFITTFSFILIGFFIGYYKFAPSREEKIPFAKENNSQEKINDEKKYSEDFASLDENNEALVTYLENSINQNTKVIYKTFYSECDDSLEEVLAPESTMIGLKEDSLKEYLQSNDSLFSVESFSVDEIVLYQNKNTVCPQHYNHYCITQKDGYIAIYHFKNNGEKVLIETTSIPISILPHVDQEKLRKGIFKKTMEEAYQLLEDYSS